MNNSFTILPMSHRFSLDPGKTYTGSLSIINPADATEDFLYSISVMPYGVVGEEYAADLASQNARTEIVKWIKISEPTGRVKPNDTKEVEFTITVPSDALPGGQYAAIAVSSDTSTQEQNGVAVNNVFELASIIYGNVSGKIKHSGEILENSVPGFVTSTPVTLSALLSNEGNVHEDATFLIHVEDAFTGRVILPTEENEGQYYELIMPESTREISRNVDNLPTLGVVKIKQTIYYRGEVSVEEKNVVICPIWFMALVLVTIAAIVATIVAIVRKHKKKATVI